MATRCIREVTFPLLACHLDSDHHAQHLKLFLLPHRTKHVPLGLSQSVVRVVRGNWSATAALSLRMRNSNCVAVGCCPTPNFQTETDTSSSQHGTEATSLICPPLNLPYKCTTQHTLFCKVIEHKSKMKSFYCCCHFWFSGTFMGPPNV